MKVVLDCHMVGQSMAGDAGNARYTASLCTAMLGTAGAGQVVEAMVSHPGVAETLGGVTTWPVAAAGARRLLWDAPRALRRSAAELGIFNYAIPARTGCATAVIVHDASFVHDPQWLPPRARRVLNAMVPRAVARADLVISVSETAAGDISASLGIDPARVAVVPNYAAEPFRPDGPAQEVAARRGLGRFVLAVGDIGPRKNLGALAEAVSLVGADGLELVIVGRRRAAAQLNGHEARFLGHIPDGELAALYRSAAVVCAPSLYEGFGLTLLEALACGAPVVASDRGAHPEVARDAALLVPPTAAGLAEGLRAALEPTTAGRLSERGPAAARRFSATDSGNRAWAAVEKILS